MNHPRHIARRRFLTHSAGLAAGSLLPLAGTRASVSDGRLLSFVHTHTRERIQLVYAVSDTYVPDALKSLNRFLRDHYSGEIGAMIRGSSICCTRFRRSSAARVRSK